MWMVRPMGWVAWVGSVAMGWVDPQLRVLEISDGAVGRIFLIAHARVNHPSYDHLLIISLSERVSAARLLFRLPLWQRLVLAERRRPLVCQCGHPRENGDTDGTQHQEPR